MGYRLSDSRSHIEKRYRVDIVFSSNYDFDATSDWIKENLKGGYYSGKVHVTIGGNQNDNIAVVPYYFVKKEDAALFKLRWG